MEEFQSVFERLRGGYSQFRTEPEEFLERGDWLAAGVRAWARGRTSGADVDSRYADLWTFREGTVRHRRQLPDLEAALEAVAPGQPRIAGP